MLTMGYFLLSSCSDDKDEPVTFQDLSMTVGESVEIGKHEAWLSTNDFVATVSDGILKASHVGKCTVINKKDQNRIFHITVSPKITFITEPLLKWGTSKSSVIAKYGQDYKVSGDAIGYSTGDIIMPLVTYVFKNNGLSSAGILVSTIYTESLGDFLCERYQPIKMDDPDIFYFVNGYTSNTITTVVMMSLFNTSYWQVAYMPYSTSVSRGGDIPVDMSDFIKTMVCD